MIRSTRSLAPFLFSLSLAPGIASATSIEKMNLSKLATRADLVVVGTVTSIEEQVRPDSSLVCRFVSLSDLDVIAGQYDGPSLTLQLEGGTFPDGRVLMVPGMPGFAEGERYLLFVGCGNGKRPCPVMGWTQGQFRLVDSSVGDDSALEDAAGQPILGLRNAKLVKPRPIAAEPEADEELVDAEPASAADPAIEYVEPAEFAGRRLSVAELRQAVLNFRASAPASTRPVPSTEAAAFAAGR